MMGPIKRGILTRLNDKGPAWARSFQPAKRNLDTLIDAGLVERVKPPNGRARNMVAITTKGIDLLGHADSSASAKEPSGHPSAHRPALEQLRPSSDREQRAA